MSLYPTPHISAKPEDFAPVVLMPGDPNRSRFIAKEFLTDAVCVNNVRGVEGYTGRYGGVPVSVMASGMGMPSIGIYSYELFHVFGVDTIIRVGSAGGISEKVKVRDLIIAMSASTDSSYGQMFRLPGTYAPTASFEVLRTCVETAESMAIQVPVHVGNILSSDLFYRDEEGLADSEKAVEAFRKMGVLAVEMESAALYMNAARAGKRALCICTVSDHLLTHESTTAEEREKTFTDMIELSLNTAKALKY